MSSLEHQFVDLDNAYLEIFRGSLGDPIVCCQHPHSSNLRMFQWYAEKTGFIYVSVRGMGNSSQVQEKSDLTYLQAVNDLEAVRRKLGIERWVMQGFSAGSQVALLYALTYPGSLAGLISISGFARISSLKENPHSRCSPRYPDYQADFAALHGQQVQRVPTALPSSNHYWVQINPNAWALFHDDIPVAVIPGSQLRERLKAAFEEVEFFDVGDRLKEIQALTLVVGGRMDSIVPLEESIAIHEGIPNSRLLVLENSGHGPQNADKVIFKNTVLQFLSGLPA